ncbi:hypothetical protein ACWEWG_16300 [Streptomyces sp. NPDC003758]|uniref:Uncharacterized protein n=1 Tax=Streptomyces cynarae TaxID=2981134 RepID=A0ABY6DV17_9ACTN|nr:hypothetical protein [Streptomyces cynarae]UXY18211.1 hypothetical protein N8I84_05340 [Streptomyces cynarae]
MSDRKDRRGSGYARGRDPGEPGAHSGAESQARERTVPGTASAEEGYQTERGTTAGKPLEGVEKEERARREPDTGTGERGTDGDAAGT